VNDICRPLASAVRFAPFVAGLPKAVIVALKWNSNAGQYRDIQVDRSCYYVLPLGDKWAMKLKGSERTWEFETQAEALAVAREAAQSVWRDKGLHSVVMIQQPDGQWLQDAKQGETPMPPSRSSK